MVGASPMLMKIVDHFALNGSCSCPNVNKHQLLVKFPSSTSDKEMQADGNVHKGTSPKCTASINTDRLKTYRKCG